MNLPRKGLENCSEGLVTRIVFLVSFKRYLMTGRKINFFSFSDSLLALKFFKVVANSKNAGRHFQRQTKPFFYTVEALDRSSKIKLGKRSFTCYRVDARMEDIQPSSSPTS